MTSLQSVIDAALADAAKRSGLKVTELKVLDAAAVTWPDGSLGCPKPGMMYTQALVPGYRVRIQAGAEILDYHASTRGSVSLCPRGRSMEPAQDEAIR